MGLQASASGHGPRPCLLPLSLGCRTEEATLEEPLPLGQSRWVAERALTLAVWESVVARLTAGALPTDDAGPAWALPTLGAAVKTSSTGGVALTGQRALVVEGRQGPGRVLTEPGGHLGAVETNRTHSAILGAVPRDTPPALPLAHHQGLGEGLTLGHTQLGTAAPQLQNTP